MDLKHSDLRDPRGYIRWGQVALFVFALSLIGIAAGAAIVGAIILGSGWLWALGVLMLGGGLYVLHDGIRKH